MRSPRIVLALVLVCAPAAGQSLWRLHGPQPPLVGDTTARRVGDIVTIIIDESQRIRNNEQSQFDKEVTLDAALTNFDVLPRAFEPLPAVEASSLREFDGTGRYDKEGSFETQLSAVVVDVLPNGNLVIEGRRHVIMDRETKTMKLAGIVRPFDITPQNTVMSSQVANASVSYEGQGPLTRSTNRGWLSSLLDVVWPF